MDISVNLDINKAGQFINQPVTMRAGETDNVIKATIYKDNKPYTEFKTATFNTTKVSGAVIANDPATVSGNVISYSVAPTLTNSAGKLRNSYFLLDGKTSTESFEVAILPGVSVGSDIGAYIPGLQEFQDEWEKVNSGMTGKLDDIDKSVDTFLAKVQTEIDDKNSKFTDDQKAQITSAINDLKNQVATSKSDVNAMDNKLAAIKDSVKDFDVPQITADTKEALDTANETKNTVNNLSIGIRNYLLNTSQPIKETGVNKVGQDFGIWNFSPSLNFKKGDWLTLVIDVTVDNPDSGILNFAFHNPWSLIWKTKVTQTSYHVVKSFQALTDLNDLSIKGLAVTADNSLASFEIKNASLRIGKVSADWEPAQEEILHPFTSGNRILTGDDDWNSYTESGVYTVSDAKSTGDGAPQLKLSPIWGYLFVTTGESVDIAQIYISVITYNEIYIRSYAGSPASWGEWKKVAYTSDIQASSPVAATAYSAMVQDADTSTVKAQNAQIAYSLMTGDTTNAK